MKKVCFSAVGILLVLFAWRGDLVMAQGKYELKAPNGVSFSEIRGYETWPFIAPSYRTDNNELRVILGNNAMIDSYKAGISGNGKAFSEGSIIVKIGWSERKSPVFPAAREPDILRRVEFIVKDTARFPATGGWGYARFVYDEVSGSYTPYGKDESFARECFQCHTIVKERDFIFTGYPKR